MRGQIVCSKSGRDKGRFMAVVEDCGGTVLVCDGKERPLERPKRKNIKHIALTKSCLDEENLMSNRSLRRALKVYNGESIREEE